VQIDQRRAKRILWFSYAFFLALLASIYAASRFRPDVCGHGCKNFSNIYGLHAALGAFFGFTRAFSGASGFHDRARYSPFWICCGLVIWTIGQFWWMYLGLSGPSGQKYPWWDDLAYLGAIMVWTFLGLGATLFRFLDRDIRDVGDKILGTALSIWGALTVGVVAVNQRYPPKDGSCPELTLISDITYVLLTSLAGFLAFALILGPSNPSTVRRIKARPMEWTLNYLCAGALVHMIANFAFIVTQKTAGIVGGYSNGGWVDCLLLTAIHAWCLGVVEHPVGRKSAFYLISEYPHVISKADVEHAATIFNTYIGTDSNLEQMRGDWHLTDWIVHTIPKCWTVAKYCGSVVGGALVIPVNKNLKASFLEGRISEREMVETAQNEASPNWESLYLAAAAVVPDHRGRHLALECLTRAIQHVRDDRNPAAELFCWPVSDGGNHLIHEVSEKLHVRIAVRRD